MEAAQDHEKIRVLYPSSRNRSRLPRASWKPRCCAQLDGAAEPGSPGIRGHALRGASAHARIGTQSGAHARTPPVARKCTHRRLAHARTDAHTHARTRWHTEPCLLPHLSPSLPPHCALPFPPSPSLLPPPSPPSLPPSLPPSFSPCLCWCNLHLWTTVSLIGAWRRYLYPASLSRVALLPRRGASLWFILGSRPALAAGGAPTHRLAAPPRDADWTQRVAAARPDCRRASAGEGCRRATKTGPRAEGAERAKMASQASA